MEYIEIRDEVIQIIRAADGQFMSAYQVCLCLEQKHEELWKRLVAAYPSADVATPMGKGTGHKYSPATFVANALAYFANEDKKEGRVPSLRQERLSCEGVSFSKVKSSKVESSKVESSKVDPGYTGNVIGIWAIQGAEDPHV